MHLTAFLRLIWFPSCFFNIAATPTAVNTINLVRKNSVPNVALAGMSLKTNRSFIQNYKVTRSELRFHICCRTLTGPECSDTSVRLLQRRGRRRRRRVLDAVQRCQSSSQLLFWEKEHIPLCWLPLLLSLHRTATHCDQPAVVARSFLSH